MIDWNKTKERYIGKTAVAGIDLSAVKDFTSISYLFQNDDHEDVIDVLIQTFCPRPTINDRYNRFSDIYEGFEREGWLIATEGPIIDYKYILKILEEDFKLFNFVGINVDRKFQGYQFIDEIESRGVKAYPVSMGYNLSLAAREFEQLMLSSRLNHGGNKLFEFCMNNTTVRRDMNDNIFIDKSLSDGRIDPVVSTVLALDRAVREEWTTYNTVNDGSLLCL